MIRRRALLALAGLAALAACAPDWREAGPAVETPRVSDDVIVAADGARLPLRRWLPAGRPRAVILALHGMNDHAGAFALPAEAWVRHGIATYAYDQRGFGRAPHRGYWPGAETLVGDLKAAFAAVAPRHPGVPVYLVGESMGGAVIMLAMSRAEAPAASGVVLSAPAVWSRDTMPFYYRTSLWLGARMAPGVSFSGRNLNRVASDNREMLAAMARDPAILRRARVDAVEGMVALMDAAYGSAGGLRAPALLLYGANDQIIPKAPMADVAARLPAAVRVAYYANGWHLLMRDRQRDAVHADIAAWIADRRLPLPSGADRDARAALAKAAAE
jgi:alpha-beta hydrolase superfamily lysophospholipase